MKSSASHSLRRNSSRESKEDWREVDIPLEFGEAYDMPILNDAERDENGLPYRSLWGWFLTSNFSNLERRVPLPADPGMKKNIKGKCPFTLVGFLQSVKSPDLPRIRVRITEFISWSVDRSSTLRGIWMQTPHAFYWLKTPSDVKPLRSFRLTSKYLPKDDYAHGSQSLQAALPSQEETHVEINALFFLVSNLCDMFMFDDNIGKSEVLRMHASKTPEEVYERLVPRSELQQENPDKPTKPFDLDLLRDYSAFVYNHMKKYHSDLDDGSVFMQALKASPPAPEPWPYKRLKNSAEDAAARSGRLMWGEINSAGTNEREDPNWVIQAEMTLAGQKVRRNRQNNGGRDAQTGKATRTLSRKRTLTNSKENGNNHRVISISDSGSDVEVTGTSTKKSGLEDSDENESNDHASPRRRLGAKTASKKATLDDTDESEYTDESNPNPRKQRKVNRQGSSSSWANLRANNGAKPDKKPAPKRRLAIQDDSSDDDGPVVVPPPKRPRRGSQKRPIRVLDDLVDSDEEDDSGFREDGDSDSIEYSGSRMKEALELMKGNLNPTPSDDEDESWSTIASKEFHFPDAGRAGPVLDDVVSGKVVLWEHRLLIASAYQQSCKKEAKDVIKKVFRGKAISLFYETWRSEAIGLLKKQRKENLGSLYLIAIARSIVDCSMVKDSSHIATLQKRGVDWERGIQEILEAARPARQLDLIRACTMAQTRVANLLQPARSATGGETETSLASSNSDPYKNSEVNGDKKATTEQSGGVSLRRALLMKKFTMKGHVAPGAFSSFQSESQDSMGNSGGTITSTGTSVQGALNHSDDIPTGWGVKNNNPPSRSNSAPLPRDSTPRSDRAERALSGPNSDSRSKGQEDLSSGASRGWKNFASSASSSQQGASTSSNISSGWGVKTSGGQGPNVHGSDGSKSSAPPASHTVHPPPLSHQSSGQGWGTKHNSTAQAPTTSNKRPLNRSDSSNLGGPELTSAVSPRVGDEERASERQFSSANTGHDNKPDNQHGDPPPNTDDKALNDNKTRETTYHGGPPVLEPPPALGRGRGRGRHTTKPAWMTKTQSADGPVGMAENGPVRAGGSNVSQQVEKIAIQENPGQSMGRGRGRGRTVPAWMTRQDRGNDIGSALNARPPPNLGNSHDNPPSQPERRSSANEMPDMPAGRGRGRAKTVPAWMARRDRGYDIEPDLLTARDPPEPKQDNPPQMRRSSFNNEPPTESRGRGRGRDTTLPAWMTRNDRGGLGSAPPPQHHQRRDYDSSNHNGRGNRGRDEQAPQGERGRGRNDQPPYIGRGRVHDDRSPNIGRGRNWDDPPPQPERGSTRDDPPPQSGWGRNRDDQPPPQAVWGRGRGDQPPPAQARWGRGRDEQPPSPQGGRGRSRDEQPPPLRAGRGRGHDEQPPSQAGRGRGRDRTIPAWMANAQPNSRIGDPPNQSASRLTDSRPPAFDRPSEGGGRGRGRGRDLTKPAWLTRR